MMMYQFNCTALIVSLFLTSCTVSGDVQPNPAPKTNDPLVAKETIAINDTNQSLMYYVLLGELAGQRGDVETSTNSYLQAAMKSQSPKVAERALQVALYSRNWAIIESAAKRWVALDETNVTPHRVMVSLHIHHGNVDLAYTEVERVLALTQSSKEAEFNQLLKVFEQAKKPSVITTILKKMVQAEPANTERYFLQARYAARNGNLPLAQSAVENILKQDPDHISAIVLKAEILTRQKKVDDAFNVFEKALSNHPDSLRLQIGNAKLLAAVQQNKKAIQAIEKIYEENPDNGKLVFGLALLAIETQHLDNAKKYLNQTIQLKTQMSESHLYLGRIEDKQLNFDQAIYHYTQVKHRGGRFEARLRIAELIAAQGYPKQALTQLSFLRNSYSGPDHRVNIDLVEADILRSSDKGADALKLLTASLQAFPENTRLRYMRALQADAQNDSQTFEADMAIVLQKEPDNAHALNAMGYYLADKGIRLKEADTMITRANELLPNDPAILDSVGWVKYRQGIYEEALKYLRKAYQLMPESEIAAHLGEVLWVSGEKEEAQKIWDQALKLSPNNKILQEVIKRLTGKSI